MLRNPASQDLAARQGPTMRALLQIARTANIQAVQAIIGNYIGVDEQLWAILANEEFFSVDQLDRIIMDYGRSVNRNLRLGWYNTARRTVGLGTRLPDSANAHNANEEIIWIEYDSDGMGHFSAIAEVGYQPVRDDSIAQYDEENLVLNLSLMAGLVRIYNAMRTSADTSRYALHTRQAASLGV
jgi:hypothetical protein